jgi:hypothetical protein
MLKGNIMTPATLELIREWDAKCGDNETTFFPVTRDRRRLLEHVDELRGLLRACSGQLLVPQQRELLERIDIALNR